MKNNKKYASLNRKPQKFTKKINAFIPTPNSDDYKKGYIQRYFVQKSNDNNSPIYELNSTNISSYRRNTYYITATLKWRISGPLENQYNDIGEIKNKGVKESNRISISLLNDSIPSLKFYLRNLTQFYKS
jgi:hypothetical protein